MAETRDSQVADTIVNQAADAIIFADSKGVIRQWNAAAEAVFGFTAEEALGQGLDLIIPERLRQTHWTAFDRAIESGVTKLGGKATLTRGLHKSKPKLYVDMSFAVVRNASGTIVGAVADARDVTTKFEEQKELRQRLTECQRKLPEREAPAR